MKEKIYVSVIINDIISQDYFRKIENFILEKFEYSEFILLFNDNNFNIDELRKKLSPISDNILCLNICGNSTIDNIIRAGLEFSKGDIVFVIKDLSIYNIENYINELYKKNKCGFDVAFFVSKYSCIKDKIFIKIFSIYSNTSIFYDICFLVTRRVINAISENKTKTLPLSSIIRNIGYKYYEAYSEIKKIKKYRLTKENRTVYIMMFSDIASSFITISTAMSAFITFLAGIYALVLYLSGRNPVEGWTTTFLFLSFGFTMVFGILAIIVRYLSVLAKEVYNNTVFKVRSVIKL